MTRTCRIVEPSVKIARGFDASDCSDMFQFLSKAPSFRMAVSGGTPVSRETALTAFALRSGRLKRRSRQPPVQARLAQNAFCP
jgi:hypothetical protein